MHLFAYGTLMFPVIWQRVVGREFFTQRATVSGFAAFRVVGGSYPVMCSSAATDKVEGLAYFDVDEDTINLLDEHESKLYERCVVAATLDDGRVLECEAYVLPKGNARFSSGELWSAEWFQAEAADEYIRQLMR